MLQYRNNSSAYNSSFNHHDIYIKSGQVSYDRDDMS